VETQVGIVGEERVLGGAVHDDLSRDVYCMLGTPVDATSMSDVLSSIRLAAATNTRFLISTPNLNFVVSRLTDPEFAESLLLSDLCPADGIAIVWLAKLMGIPIRNRVAGSDMFEALKAERGPARPLNVFLFGGAEGVAEAAYRALNAERRGLHCVGLLCPGFGSVDDMSRPEILEKINSSGADFLVVALGAKKGQSWLLRNHDRLRIPVRVHLGAVLNFQAGTVKRAPQVLRKLALEWLWRIKEEPQLWRRYWNDGCVLLRLVLTRVLPIAISSWGSQPRAEQRDLSIALIENDESVELRLAGYATAQNIERATSAFRRAVATNKPVVVDFSDTHAIDARFVGLLLMLSKTLKSVGATPKLIGLSWRLQRLFRLHGADFLLACPSGYDVARKTVQTGKKIAVAGPTR
jgi:N-acetylglucosaminyldiphosphoundecaprenol N-acetyl-beta-D-mannosaminyltransferase